MDTTIKNLSAIEILDSRGNPTLEVEITLKNGTTERVGVPSGASTGIHEAVELRDNDAARYNGKGVLKAVNHVNTTIADLIIGMNALNQTEIDLAMIHLDGTTNKSQLGANAIVGVSLAVCKAAATAKQLALFQYLGGINATRLPCPMFNVLNGGIHANWQGADIQEFMICPVGAPNFAEALRWASETYHHLKAVLKENNYSVGIGDEGGFAPALTSNSQALELIVIAIEKAGYQAGRDIAIAIDPASSGFYDENTQLYYLKSEGKYLSAVEMIAMYADWVNQYPLILLEDGLAEDDWAGWALLNNKLGDKIELVGDDIFVTNVTRLARGIKDNIANSVLIKPNQIGTLTETIATVKMAYSAGWGAMVSHRSGETTDSFIADFSVAMNTGHLKTGAPCRGERLEKYNQLLRIEKKLGQDASYAGRQGFIR